MSAKSTNSLPRTGPAREVLRQKGQFWTPQWVARAMVRWACANGSDTVFDPAVGAGAFFVAAKDIYAESQRRPNLIGREVDKEPLHEALRNSLGPEEMEAVEIRDFVLDPPARHFASIVANPPYIRHHRLSSETKQRLRTMSLLLFGIILDGRAGYHVYFLLRALSLLQTGGRLAFIVPADICEGIFAATLWDSICSRYRLAAVVTFSPEATPFPGVDTNPIVVFLENTSPSSSVKWVRVLQQSDAFEATAQAEFPINSGVEIRTEERNLDELLAAGLSRPRNTLGVEERPLGVVAKCMRGVASGDNDFFLLTDQKARELGIGAEFLLPVLAKTRYAVGDRFSQLDFDTLRLAGYPVWLLALDGRPISAFPLAVQKYLEEGVRRGIPDKPLIGTRNPWYKMEKRNVPPFLFAYLGRRQARFIRNEAGVVPLTGFLCVYEAEGVDTDDLWDVLSSDIVRDNLHRVGKSYGSGAIKVEPRALERTPVPAQLIAGLTSNMVPTSLF